MEKQRQNMKLVWIHYHFVPLEVIEFIVFQTTNRRRVSFQRCKTQHTQNIIDRHNVHNTYILWWIYAREFLHTSQWGRLVDAVGFETVAGCPVCLDCAANVRTSGTSCTGPLCHSAEHLHSLHTRPSPLPPSALSQHRSLLDGEICRISDPVMTYARCDSPCCFWCEEICHCTQHRHFQNAGCKYSAVTVYATG